MGVEQSTEGRGPVTSYENLAVNTKHTMQQQQQQQQQRQTAVSPAGLKQNVINQEVNDADQRLVRNSGGGFSFKVCDMNRLRRFIVLGSENNSYYSNPAAVTLENVMCIKNLLEQKRHQEVLDTITEYSISGRIAKEEPILSILAMCASHKDLDIKKAAFNKVVQICNIPTKLFRFLELTQEVINAQRKIGPPSPQPFRNKRKRPVEETLESLKIEDDDKVKEPSENTDTSLEPSENTDTSMEPIENTDTSLEPKKKKKKKKDPEYKKVNKAPSKSSGWGRMRRKSIAAFYVDEKKDAARLLQLVTKYKARHTWNHKQVLGYAHPKVSDDGKNLVLKYCALGYEKIKEYCDKLAQTPGINEDISNIICHMRVINEVEKLDPATPGDEDRLLEILKTNAVRKPPKEFSTTTTMSGDTVKENAHGKKGSFQIVREHLPTGFLNSKKVWEALLQDMPMTALVRNLGKMTSMNLFDDNEDNVAIVVNSLTNKHKLKAARIHPMKILLALKIYEQGHGDKGSLTWVSNDKISNALDEAFYLSFKQPEVQDGFKTGKRHMLCLDVSGSMTFRGCVGTDLITPAEAAAAMSWVTWNIEGDVDIVAFGRHLENMKDLGFNKDMRLNEVAHKTSRMGFGSTDCSLPMVHALQNRMEVDVFIVYTDSETNSNRIPPAQALREYNRGMRRDAKLIVCGLMSNGFTVADPSDPNMMDIAGFDSNVPELISEFALGKLSGKCSNVCKECNTEIP